MPELPEVETICRGISPIITGKQIKNIVVRQPKLRYPLAKKDFISLTGKTVHQVKRRGKYIRIILDYKDEILIHLGMSGTIVVTSKETPIRKHEHFSLFFDKIECRYHDPRKFGLVIRNTIGLEHSLLKRLGEEPMELEPHQWASKMITKTKKMKRSIKSLLMNQNIIAGLGNIYVNEILFLAKILPHRYCCTMNSYEYKKVAQSTIKLLLKAIELGGTTLKDFVNNLGNPGYFSQQLQVYGRENKPCFQCHTIIKKAILNQRSTYWCEQCQT